MTRIIGFSGRRGFSLIEVMVAVVILATGLLALAALQGSLARNSADTKARSAVMAALSSRMAQIRQAPPSANSTWTMSTPWVSSAAAQAGTSDLQVVESVAAFRWNGSSYVNTAVSNPLSSFTRATLVARWIGADGAKALTLASDFSSMIYGLGMGYPTVDPNGSAAKFPVVRQLNPSNTAGVIPIVSGNQATAASNPQPIKEGATNNLLVGTSFDVLNYVPEGTTAKITKRFETQVIKCRCEFGASAYSVVGEPQWPAVWDGGTYSLYAAGPSPSGVIADAGEDDDASGNTRRGRGGERLQSERCTECCRDHHDAAATATAGRYDPEASGVGKFNESGGTLTPVSSGKYVAACRVVRVDGLWRTTADTYQRHYGLLETTASNTNVQAKSGFPTSSASSAYQTYVKDYLSQYTATSTSAPSGAQSMFDQIARNLNSPATISVANVSIADYRYLHGRGLYVDYLGTKAQEAIGKCTGKTGSNYTECVLPALPFTTINLTEMATWAATDSTVLNVNTTKALNWDEDQPSGGRTAGIKVGSASNISSMRLSNSGVAVSYGGTQSIPDAVDTNGDGATASDSQAFQVGGTTPSAGDVFLVSTSGGGSNPYVAFLIGAQSGNCTYSGSSFSCPTTSTLPSPGTITLSNYNVETTYAWTFSPTTTTGCTRQLGDSGNINGNPSVTTARPRFTDHSVQSVSNGGTVNISAPLNPGKTTESTLVTLTAIPKSPTVIGITLQAGTVTDATLASCIYKKSGSNVVVVSTTWNKPWQ